MHHRWPVAPGPERQAARLAEPRSCRPRGLEQRRVAGQGGQIAASSAAALFGELVATKPDEGGAAVRVVHPGVEWNDLLRQNLPT